MTAGSTSLFVPRNADPGKGLDVKPNLELSVTSFT
jgi:hypothetical protein